VRKKVDVTAGRKSKEYLRNSREISIN